MARYSFVTRWGIEGPLERVWDAIFRSDEWPAWWRGVERVERIRPAAGLNEVGSVRRFIWKSRLPYRLTFDMTVTRVEPLKRIVSAASGDLEGTGVWTLESGGPRIFVRYDWNVRTTPPWMNALAPLARPLFRWNHDAVMRWGAEGLARRVVE